MESKALIDKENAAKRPKSYATQPLLQNRRRFLDNLHYLVVDGGVAYSSWLLIPFVAALIYTLVQMVGNWTLYLAAHRAPHTQYPLTTQLRVDVFITACGEEPALIERAVLAPTTCTVPASNVAARRWSRFTDGNKWQTVWASAI